MDIMDSMWTDDGMVMEWLIPYGMGAYPCWIPWTSPHGFHGTILYGFHGDSMEQGSISVGNSIVKNNVTK
jgi:hypothetical protein